MLRNIETHVMHLASVFVLFQFSRVSFGVAVPTARFLATANTEGDSTT